ncbi:PREDICTED: histone-lysine N-methyltransferase ash1 [Nicrophorus vespilloides]|uniref:Histone-lysine N-methyltransferase ash1 n=1 Tax=Nicrophorus vespilloides TaxID=110193 RepID=A0ABM1MC76_NICVS|nr:PREDICTED: histone-lysine N-methyltransferase ash1 [Nicrophorus vespilloides]
MASLPLSRSAPCSSSDSDESDADSAMLASCSLQLQEIRQEDLAAILPDQQELDAFGAFEETEKSSPQTGDASGSDMELPQQAVNAIIQRTTESSSESESHPPPNPSSLYANSLLQQFVAQTQLLSTSTSQSGGADGGSGPNQNGGDAPNALSADDSVKRKRGRPKKINKNPESSKIVDKSLLNIESYTDPNVSPDSGIQNSPDHVSSPDCSPLPVTKGGKYGQQEKKCQGKSSQKIKEQQAKLPVTSNRFDRILYGNTDRVLYPPRRKVGRPPIVKKGPGRPPKNKVESKPAPTKMELKSNKTKKSKSSKDKEIQQLTTNTNSLSLGNTNNKANGVKENSKSSKSTHLYNICERVSKRLELNKDVPQKQEGHSHKTKSNNNRVILGSKNKIDRVKNKYLALKNAKLMHSKHKHKKHKKCKFKILKPLATAHVDPKLNSEIDKLVQDFVKLCNISTCKPAKENVPEILKNIKKVSKKRKTSDNVDRKKKKQSTTTINKEPTSNEQRLPLKKRHYHLTTNENKPEEVIVSEDSKNKNKILVEKKVEQHPQPSPIKSANSSPKVPTINNNEYGVSDHIEEAIEACITKYTSPKLKEVKVEEVSPKEEKPASITATTPKKRHRLEQAAQEIATLQEKPETMENVVSEMNLKRNLTAKLNEVTKRIENNTAQMNTRKKNRLEDLTSNLASKISPAESSDSNKRKKEVKSEVRATVIKYPACKKAKPIEPEILESVVDEKPTGIFMPTVDLEINIPEAADHDTNTIPEVPETIKNDIKTIPTSATTATVASNKIAEVKKRVRKRRAINRTGFPTVKKKKKKIVQEIIVPIINTPEINSCDRVPKDGEEYSSFVERSEKSDTEKVSSDLYKVSKWEVSSECDSLPQEDRIDFDSLDVKQERMSLRNSSPSTSVDTSKKTDTSSDVDDLTLEARIERFRKKNKLRRRHGLERKCNEGHLKKRLRDTSPASSIEAFDKRFKDDRASASGDEKKNRKVPRWRKKCLLAGLFSDYYKEDDETIKMKRNEYVTTKTKLSYNPEEHPYGLLPAPYHCGKYLRCRKIEFQLPYDLWWQHTHSQLPGRDLVPSWNYRKIRTNIYNVKNTAGACEPQPCNCSPQSGCGDDCINRLVLAECPATHKCQNQKIQKHEWSPGIEKFMTESKGWGVRTNSAIKNGDFILEYVGEVVSDQEFKERMASRYVHDTHHYCLHLDGGLVIDGHRMGGDGRFVNHSCQPNCEMQKWSVNGQFRMALFSLREIKPGEELTYDYNFSLFNPAEGQECKCGSENCRGVIGGKSQRVRQIPVQNPPPQAGRVGRPRKNQAKKATSNAKEVVTAPPPLPPPASIVPQMKPISHSQRLFVLEHHCFLLRNLKKVKRVRDRSLTSTVSRTQAPTPTDQISFLNHLNALRQPRNMKTRQLAQAEDDPELHKTVRLANLLRDIFNVVIKYKDGNDEKLSTPFMLCPAKRKVPEYYQKITEPIDLTTIEQNIETGVYKNVESFDADMNRIFTNVIKFYGRTADLGVASTRLKKVYNEAKKESLPKFQHVLGVKPPAKFTSNKKKGEEEDIIRCICGMFRDEGLMIQCERCLVWQHCECVKANADAPSYHCEKCVARDVDYEIPMDEYTEHGHQYYMTLMRGELQLRQGDTVYVLRDIPIPGTDKKHTYDTIGEIKYADLDIFRIERLWKDSKNGTRFAYGHHYLRPHETYHEPTRKFYSNEVMRVPLYEAVPVELIISHCWVMDFNTYCKGRPIGAPEEHIYICEYRVDKGARLFSKVSKSKFPICTKTYAFERFDTRLKVTRTYTPHDLDPMYTKQRGRKPQEVEEVKETVPAIPAAVHVPIVRTPTEQKARLNGILLNLLSKLPTKQSLDVSYLLEGGRRRGKNRL